MCVCDMYVIYTHITIYVYIVCVFMCVIRGVFGRLLPNDCRFPVGVLRCIHLR